MKRRSILTIPLAFILVVSIFAGCSSEDEPEETEPEESAAGTQNSADVDDGDYYVEIETTDGSMATFTDKPLAAVMDVAILDIMDALGHEDYIVGVAKRNTGRSEGLSGELAKYDDDAYLDVSKVESREGEEVDTYADLRNANPDLIFAGSRRARDSADSEAESMSEIAPTITFDSNSGTGDSVIETLESQVATIVDIYGGEELAEEYFSQINEKLELLQESVDGSSAVLFGMRKNVLTTEVEMLGTAATFLTADIGFNSLIDVGEEEDDDDHDNNGDAAGVDGEMIVDLNPDYIIVVRSDQQQSNASEEDTLTAEEQVEALGLEACDAYQNDRIIYLDNAIWRQNAGGFRDLIAMLDDMIDILGLA